MPDDVGVTDAALVETVARAMFAAWADRMDVSRTYECQGTVEENHYMANARAAIAAMQPAMDAAREAGRREGLEQAATTCERKANDIRRVNTYRGKVNAHGDWGSWVADNCAEMVRTLIPAAPAPMEAADAR